MATETPVYDPESDEEEIPYDASGFANDIPGHHSNADHRPSSGDAGAFRDQMGVSDEDDTEMDHNGLDATDLAEQEQAGGGSFKFNKGDEDGGGDNTSGSAAGAGATGASSGLFSAEDGKGSRSKIRGKLSGLKSKKLLIAGAGGGVASIGIVIVLLILFASSLKIPDLAQNITTYEFARLTRQYSSTAERTTAERLATMATDNATLKALQDKYANVTSQVSDTWSKLDKYRPQKVIQNLGANTDTGLKLNFNGDKFLGGTLNGQDFTMSQQGGTRFIPVYGKAVTFKNNFEFSQSFAPALEATLKTTEAGPIVRGLVANSIRKELGISLIAWTVGKYTGKKDAAARILEERDKMQAVDGGDHPPAAPGIDEQANNAETAGETATADTLSTDAGIQSVIDNGGVVQSAKDAVGNALAQTPLQDITSLVNPVAKIATPLCIIFDGSLNQSKTPIDNQVKQQTAAFYYMTSGADQQKNGSYGADGQGSGLGQAVNAANSDLGDTSHTNAEIRAGGGNPDTSTTNVSAEASADGEFTLFNALGLPSFATGFLNGTAATICPVATNLGVQIGLGLANLGISLIPGVGEGVDGAEVAATTATDTVTQTVSKNILQRLVSKFVDNKITSIGSKAGKLVLDTGKNAAEIASVTVLAKLIVNARMGAINSGTAQGADLANEADAGGNIHANELERTQLFGRPLLMDEVCQSNKDDLVATSNQERQKSAYTRYLATTNAGSLLSRTAVAVDGTFSGSLGSSFVRFSSNLMKPSSLLGTLANVFLGRTYAATNCSNDSTDYGNVQFGWSDDEESLKNGDSYGPLENQAALDAAPPVAGSPSVEAAIAKKYANCFGYDYNAGGDGSFDPTDPNSDMTLADGQTGDASLGTVLSASNPPDIVRDEHGNVQDQGLCSKSNLTYTNNEFGPGMVFRWRLAMRYDTTIGQLNDEQNITTSDSTGTSSAASGQIEQGTPAQLAQKILNYKTSGQYNCDNPGDCTDLQKVVSGTSLAGSQGCQATSLDPKVLQLMLYVIETGHFQIGTFALCGDHSSDGPGGHSGGHAVDFSSVNGVSVATNSDAAKASTLLLDQFLNKLPAGLQLNQQISYGYGNHPDTELQATQQANGKLCTSSCVSFYTQTVEDEHENHIHAGF